MPFKMFVIVMLFLVSGVFSAYAQSEEASVVTPPTLAARMGNAVAILNPDGMSTTIEEDLTLVSSLKWSPDGQTLAYTVYSETGYALKVTDAQGSAPTTLVEGISYFPITFTPDSTQIVYAVEPPLDQISEGENGPVYALPLYTVNVDSTGEPTQIGEIPNFRTGCGGTAPLPMDMLYQEDAGYMGTGLMMEYTPVGIVHSMGCNGLGLGVLNLETGEDTILSDSFGNAVLSPDKTLALVNVYNTDQMQHIGITIVDLQTGETSSPVEDVTAQPDQLAWGVDGSLYYSTRTLLDEPLALPEGMTQLDTGIALLDNVSQYEVGLYRISEGETTELYRGNDWAISRIFTDENGVYFNVIPNVQDVFAQIESGELSAEGFVLDRSHVAPTLYFLANGSDAPTAVIEGITMAAPQPIQS